MTSLVLLEYDGGAIKQPSRSAVAAAQKLGEIHVLVAGTEAAPAAAAAAKLPGVAKVLIADAPAFDHALAEPLAALLVSLAPAYSHLLAATTAVGKNIMPRVAALLDVQPISDIADVVDADTFVRPIYAGNALATVKSADADEGHHRARRQLRPGAGRGRQRDRPSRRASRTCRACRASFPPNCPRASGPN